jgi:hypothetical protein
MIHIIPVDVPEEGMAHNLLSIRGAGTEALLGFAGEELLEDRHRVARHVDRVEGLICENGVVDFVFVLAAEGRLLQQHLVDQDTKGPPVDRSAIFLV